MPTLLYHTRITVQNIAATTAQAGFPASSLISEALGRPWRASNAAATDITIDLGASQALGGVLMHDVNFATATIYTSVDGATYTNRGTMTAYANSFGRRRGVFSLNGFTGRYVRVSIGAGTPLATSAPALGVWSAGAAYVMKVATSLAKAPNKGYDVEIDFAQIHNQLSNRQTAVAAAGTPFDTIRWQFLRKYTDSLDVLMTQLRQGIVIVDMGLPQFPHHVWPVRYIETNHKRAYPKANSEASAVALTEVV